jgi:hypothetical protein
MDVGNEIEATTTTRSISLPEIRPPIVASHLPRESFETHPPNQSFYPNGQLEEPREFLKYVDQQSFSQDAEHRELRYPEHESFGQDAGQRELRYPEHKSFQLWY